MGLKETYLTGSSEKKRESNDFYPTPPYATEKLLEKEIFVGDIWECACGDGAISKVLIHNGYNVTSTDLFDQGYGEIGMDFLQQNRLVDNIVTNPPYKLAEEFLEHGLKQIKDGGKLVMLLKLNFLEGQKRHKLFNDTPLKTVYVFSKRLSFDKGNEKGKGSGVLAYAWYVWEKGYVGKPTLDWIL